MNSAGKMALPSNNWQQNTDAALRQSQRLYKPVLFHHYKKKIESKMHGTVLLSGVSNSSQEALHKLRCGR